MNPRAALFSLVAVGVGAACTLDHTIGQQGAGGGPGFCPGGGGLGSGGGGPVPTPVVECDPHLSGSCDTRGEHCLEAPESNCTTGLCEGWCMPPQTLVLRTCSIGMTQCPVGMNCVRDPYSSCDPSAMCGCVGACYGVDLQASAGLTGVCAGQSGVGCTASEHCVADPSASCSFDGGAECGGVCIPAAQPSAIACGSWPDFTCPAATHCLQNPAHGCLLPLDCPGLCWPN